jgi:Glycosyltransferase
VFVAVSEYAKKEIQRVYPNLNIQVIHNGVDTDTFTPHKNSESDSTGNFKIIAMASDFKDKRKGFLTLIRALSILANKDIKNSFSIDLIGNLHLPFIYRHLIRDITVKAHGYVNEKKDIVKILSRANLFVNLSRNETFCLSNVEAMACGTPVLLLNNRVNKEIVGDMGTYLENSHPQEVAQVIENIINHKILLPDPSSLRQRSLKFTIKNCAAAYKELYHKLTRHE